MCGIAGCVGAERAVDEVIEQLSLLEYRGYDSAGIACPGQGSEGLRLVRVEGRIERLAAAVAQADLAAPSVAIGHTRWATHGGPSSQNAHPHTDCAGRIAVCHNGIIENHRQLREWLTARGHVFRSQTDTEVIPHLIEELLLDQADPSPVESETAIREALARLKGSLAVTILCDWLPDRVYCFRQNSSLLVSKGPNGVRVASDAVALGSAMTEAFELRDGDFATLRSDSIEIERLDGGSVKRRPINCNGQNGRVGRDGHAHYMHKEIHEQPEVLRQILEGRVKDDRLSLPELDPVRSPARHCSRIYLVACGTAYHAALGVRDEWERRLRVPVQAEVASEFRYREPALGEEALVVLISQSGETADTLAAMREASRQGAATIAVVNSEESALAREASAALFCRAGKEVAVASTKAYVSQLACLHLLGLWLEGLRMRQAPDDVSQTLSALRAIPAQLQQLLANEDAIVRLAEEWRGVRDWFFLGRGLDHGTALEGALKLKEISYLHAEGFPAGELKHGPLALITPEAGAVCIATQSHLTVKMASNVEEVRSRGARLLVLTRESDTDITREAADVLPLPDAPDFLMPILSILPLQLLAYHVALLLGRDIDQPRNLAKSVTVE